VRSTSPSLMALAWRVAPEGSAAKTQFENKIKETLQSTVRITPSPSEIVVIPVVNAKGLPRCGAHLQIY
jgi:hypothetical protein